jgi:hypothetical protein
MNSENSPQGQFWHCQGTKDTQHLQLTHNWAVEKCYICGSSRPRRITSSPEGNPSAPTPNSPDIFTPGRNTNFPSDPTKINTKIKSNQKTDRGLLIPLTILNLVSGFTTVQGAVQVLPPMVAFPAGLSVQLMLFLLVSSPSRLQDAPGIKKLVIAIFSFLSIYTSCFSYYDILTGRQNQQNQNQAASAMHAKLIREVFKPIEQEAETLKNAIADKEKKIKEERGGRRGSAIAGCGPKCKELKQEKENMETNYQQVSAVVEQLKPYFDKGSKLVETPTSSADIPQQVFDADIKALGRVQPNCLPTKPTFNCLPSQYQQASNPDNPEYKILQSKYVEQTVGLLQPIIRVSQGDGGGIASLALALMVDGSILLLGKGIESKQKARKISLTVTGKGSSFIEEIPPITSEGIIDFNSVKDQLNRKAYSDLLSNIKIEAKWLYPGEIDGQWEFISPAAEDRFIRWLSEEKERQIKQEHKQDMMNKLPGVILGNETTGGNPNRRNTISVELPIIDD